MRESRLLSDVEQWVSGAAIVWHGEQRSTGRLGLGQWWVWLRTCRVGESMRHLAWQSVPWRLGDCFLGCSNSYLLSLSLFLSAFIPASAYPTKSRSPNQNSEKCIWNSNYVHMEYCACLYHLLDGIVSSRERPACGQWLTFHTHKWLYNLQAPLNTHPGG